MSVIPFTKQFVGARRILAVFVCLTTAGCAGTTGSDLFEFDAFASGPRGAVRGEPYAFAGKAGFGVTLARAELRVGAVYLSRSVPASVAEGSSCALQGIYVAEVPGGLDVDLLSPDLQPFPVRGDATEDRARTAEVWLMGDQVLGGERHSDVNAARDATPILVVEGTATRGPDEVHTFTATLTISANRSVVPPTNPALPGAKPLCQERMVSPVSFDQEVTPGGRLVLRVDPAAFFTNVDFAALPPAQGGAPQRFADAPEDAASVALYDGLHARSAYSFEWQGGR